MKDYTGFNSFQQSEVKNNTLLCNSASMISEWGASLACILYSIDTTANDLSFLVICYVSQQKIFSHEEWGQKDMLAPIILSGPLALPLPHVPMPLLLWQISFGRLVIIAHYSMAPVTTIQWCNSGFLSQRNCLWALPSTELDEPTEQACRFSTKHCTGPPVHLPNNEPTGMNWIGQSVFWTGWSGNAEPALL